MTVPVNLKQFDVAPADLGIGFVCQASAMELRQFLLNKNVCDHSALVLYARGLLFYLEGKEKDLKSLLEDSETFLGFEFVKNILIVRACILSGEPLPAEIREQMKLGLAGKSSSTLDTKENTWEAEACFALGIFAEVNKSYLEAERYFERSHELFTRVGLQIKSVKALHNVFSARSKRDPSLRQIPEYQNCAVWAEKAGDLSTQAMAYTNLSREFQVLKAYRVALKYANQAVTLLEREFYGSYNYYFSLCHRAHLYWELKETNLARADFEEARGTSHSEIKTALAVLAEWLGDSSEEVQDTQTEIETIPTWGERKTKGLHFVDSVSKELPEYEYRLLEALSRGPRQTHELIADIWGTSIDFLHLENRFKQLLFRIRKRFPGLIGYAESKYFLRDLELKSEPLKKTSVRKAGKLRYCG